MSIRFTAIAAVLAVLATVISDCDEVPDSTPATTRPIVQAGHGVVQGMVTFTGSRPEMRIVSKDCCPGADPVIDEAVTVNENGTLRDVVVYIKAGPNVASSDAAIQPLIIDQKNCRYLPHVTAVRAGQPIDITSHDPTLHNVHVMATLNPSQNFSETNIGASHRLTFAQPEIVHLKCDVHPWMSAYVHVFDHPYFSITGEDGAFKIDRLPPGSYTLVAWQERFGIVEKTITVSDERPAQIIFNFGGQ